MSFQLSMKFRWAARIFFVGRQNPIFLPKKFQRIPSESVVLFHFFDRKKKIKVPSIKGFFEWTLFVTQKNFLGRRSWRREKHFFFFLGGSAIENLLRPPFVWYCCTSSCLHFHLRLTYVAQEGRWRALTRGIMDSPRCVLGAHTQKNLDENGEDFQRDISLFSFFLLHSKPFTPQMASSPSRCCCWGPLSPLQTLPPQKKNNFFPWDSHYFHWNIQKWWENWGLSEFFFVGPFLRFRTRYIGRHPKYWHPSMLLDIFPCFFFHPSPPGGTWWIPPISFHRRIPPNSFQKWNN